MKQSNVEKLEQAELWLETLNEKLDAMIKKVDQVCDSKDEIQELERRLDASERESSRLHALLAKREDTTIYRRVLQLEKENDEKRKIIACYEDAAKQRRKKMEEFFELK